MFHTHNDRQININGTCLQGYVDQNYNVLVQLFGKPMYWGGPKVQWEWQILFKDGEVATIYDWKNYHIHKPEEVTNWHIGGNNPVVVTRVKNIISEYLDSQALSQ